MEPVSTIALGIQLLFAAASVVPIGVINLYVAPLLGLAGLVALFAPTTVEVRTILIVAGVLALPFPAATLAYCYLGDDLTAAVEETRSHPVLARGWLLYVLAGIDSSTILLAFLLNYRHPALPILLLISAFAAAVVLALFVRRRRALEKVALATWAKRAAEKKSLEENRARLWRDEQARVKAEQERQELEERAAQQQQRLEQEKLRTRLAAEEQQRQRQLQVEEEARAAKEQDRRRQAEADAEARAARNREKRWQREERVRERIQQQREAALEHARENNSARTAKDMVAQDNAILERLYIKSGGYRSGATFRLDDLAENDESPAQLLPILKRLSAHGLAEESYEHRAVNKELWPEKYALTDEGASTVRQSQITRSAPTNWITMGDYIVNGNGTIINKSLVQNSLNSGEAVSSDDVLTALERMREAVEESGDELAEENFERFSAELKEKEPSPAVLQTFYGRLVGALPAIGQMADVAGKIVPLFQ